MAEHEPAAKPVVEARPGEEHRAEELMTTL